MTSTSVAVAPRSLVEHVATALGWTPGQVWTVAIGLAVAVPAAIFGLGPALDVVDGTAASSMPAPPAAVAAPAPPAPPASPPALLGGAAPSTPVTRAPTAGTSPAATGAVGPAPGVDAAPVAPAGTFATVAGPGTVRAVGVAADAVVVAVDAGPDAPGRLVVLDGSGAVVLDRSIQVGDVAYRRPGGVAVTDGAVLVATADPAAVVRVGIGDGTVAAVADVPDVPLCLPLTPATGCQVAVPDQAPRPEHLALAADGSIYVADRGQACVFRIGPDENRAAPWLCDLAFVGSPATEDAGLRGLAVDDQRVVVSVASAIDGSDRVEEIAIAGGAPGRRRQLAAPGAGSGSGGVALLPDGRVLVALGAEDALLVIDADGSSRTARLDGVPGPTDVDVAGEELLLAHRVDGAAGGLARRPVPAG